VFVVPGLFFRLSLLFLERLGRYIFFSTERKGLGWTPSGLWELFVFLLPVSVLVASSLKESHRGGLGLGDSAIYLSTARILPT